MRLQQAKSYITEFGEEEACKRLRASRENVHLSQLALSRRAGVPQSNINQIENGKQSLTPRVFSKLMTVIERAEPGEIKNKADREEIGAVRKEVAKARKWVTECEKHPEWPWMNLEAAKKRLAEALGALAVLKPKIKKQKDVFENPFVKEVMESKERETAIADFTLQAIRDCAIAAGRGDEKAKELYSHWLRTGQPPITIEVGEEGTYAAWRIGKLTPEAEAAIENLGWPKDANGSVVLPEDYEELLYAQGVKKIKVGE